MLLFLGSVNFTGVAVQVQLLLKKGLIDIIAQWNPEGINDHPHWLFRGWCRPPNKFPQVFINDTCTDSWLSHLIDDLFDLADKNLDAREPQLDRPQHICHLLNNKHLRRTAQRQTPQRLIAFKILDGVLFEEYCHTLRLMVSTVSSGMDGDATSEMAPTISDQVCVGEALVRKLPFKDLTEMWGVVDGFATNAMPAIYGFKVTQAFCGILKVYGVISRSAKGGKIERPAHR